MEIKNKVLRGAIAFVASLFLMLVAVILLGFLAPGYILFTIFPDPPIGIGLIIVFITLITAFVALVPLTMLTAKFYRNLLPKMMV